MSAADVILTRVQLQISKRICPHTLKFFTFSVEEDHEVVFIF